MNFQFHIKNLDIPELNIAVGCPPKKAEEIMTSDDAAINLARCLVAEYKRTDVKGEFYRKMNDSWFFINFNEKDKAMEQLLQDHMLHGNYEPHTTKLLKEIIKPTDICLDVGASIGYFTLLLSKLGSKVYSVEATTNQFPYLQRNLTENQCTNVYAYNLGAWDKEEMIHINSNAGQVDDIKAVALDSIIKEPLDFIKMDIDGSEPKALLGLEKTIQNSPNLKMIIEYYPKYIERLELNPQDVLDFLDKYFTYSRIEGDYTEEYWNYYCIRK